MVEEEPIHADLQAALAEAQQRITDLEAALAERQLGQPGLLRTVIDNLPVSIYVRDREGRFMLANASALDIMGVDESQLVVGKKVSDLMPADIAARWEAEDRQVLETGRSLEKEGEMVTHPVTGETVWYDTTKVPLVDEAGQVIGIIGISRDTSLSRAVEQREVELTMARERVEMLRRFIDDASHDLRTPLTSMSLSLAVLQRNPDPATQQRHRAILQSQMEHLLQLLDDLLSTSRLDRRMTIELRQVDVRVMLQGILLELRTLAERKGHAVLFEAAGEPALVLADEAHLRRALMAIVTNALNYTPNGGTITIRVTPTPGQVTIAVTDTGIGISPAERAHIFERFYRADRARNTERGGLGLGLAIAHEVIEVHSGRIEVESEPGQGSTFTVFLPRVNKTA